VLSNVPHLTPRIEGPVDAPMLVFVQGWPDDMSVWDELVAALRPSYRCVRVDLPNYPGAVNRRWGYSHDEMVAGLAQCIRGVSPDRPVTLVAHDWGAFWSYRLHDRHPELVARFVALDVGPVVKPAPRELAFIVGYQLWLAAAFALGGAVGDAMTRRMARFARSPRQGAAVRAEVNYPYFYTWKKQFTGGSASLSNYLPQVPFMFIYGTQKPTRFHTQAWLDYLRGRPDNEVVELSEMGHWVTRDPQLSELVKRFLDRTRAIGHLSG
jgi:cis-3-alkyl-4-acyloxetan-2-one decarboxylase